MLTEWLPFRPLFARCGRRHLDRGLSSLADVCILARIQSCVKQKDFGQERTTRYRAANTANSSRGEASDPRPANQRSLPMADRDRCRADASKNELRRRIPTAGVGANRCGEKIARAEGDRGSVCPRSDLGAP